MKLSEKIVDDLKTAMKAGDSARALTLRSIRAAMIELEKSGEEVTDEKEMKVIIKEAKVRRDSIELYSEGNREDLVKKAEAELAIIEEYLPKQLSDEEIRQIVTEIVAEQGASDMGDFKLVMPNAMKKIGSGADGKRVQAIERELLSA